MAFTYGRKLLFSIFIDGNQGNLPFDIRLLEEEFTPDSIARDNAISKFAGVPRQVEQVGYYYNSENNQGVFTGVANAQYLIEVPENGKPQMVMDSTGKVANVQTFIDSVMNILGLPDATCIWIVVPLDELGSGFGTLFTGGMAGIQGGG
jgi:hypothetical protein